MIATGNIDPLFALRGSGAKVIWLRIDNGDEGDVAVLDVCLLGTNLPSPCLTDTLL